MSYNFDELFQAAVDAPLSTSIKPAPEGEYTAQIEKVEGREITWTKDGEEHSRAAAEITWNVTDQSILTAMEREKVTVRQTLFLDLDDFGQLDTSAEKNVGLGRIFEAAGMNEGGASIGNLTQTGPLLIRVKHRPNEKDPSSPYAEVAAVAPLNI